MRIGICGAQGVGKTTLAKALSKELKLPRIEEQARVAAMELGIEKLSMLRSTPEMGIKYQQLCLEKQIQAEQTVGPRFVSCRTTIDNALYWMKWHSMQGGATRNVDYYTKCKNHIGSYDLIVYVPPEFPIEDDGFRSINENYQKEMDMLVQMLISYFQPRNFITVHGSVESRVRKVIQELNCLGYYVSTPLYNIV